MKKSALLLFLGLTASAHADFTVQLDAGRLRLNAATTMPTGSLLLLIEAGGDNSFSNSLAPGQYVSGNDILLSATAFPGSAGSFNNSGGPDETLNAITNLPTTNTGDLVALRWFPQITYAQWQAGATPTAGQNFGTYNPLTNGNGSIAPSSTQCPGGGTANSPDCGNVWAVPSGGATINLNFFTTDSGGGGTQTPAEGYASFSVTAVPEPSTYLGGFLAASTIGFTMLRRRIKR
jgi:hypothetical protein